MKKIIIRINLVVFVTVVIIGFLSLFLGFYDASQRFSEEKNNPTQFLEEEFQFEKTTNEKVMVFYNIKNERFEIPVENKKAIQDAKELEDTFYRAIPLIKDNEVIFIPTNDQLAIKEAIEDGYQSTLSGKRIFLKSFYVFSKFIVLAILIILGYVIISCTICYIGTGVFKFKIKVD